MKASEKALKMHWGVIAGNHSLKGDLIWSEILDWNLKAQNATTPDTEPKWESERDTRFWR